MTEDPEKYTLRDFLFFIASVAILVFIISPSINYQSFQSLFNNLTFFNSQSYNPENPPIFFSTGEALSALAILFAVYLFKKEKWNLALKIRSYIIPTVITFNSLGIIFSIFSSLFFLKFFTKPQNIIQLSVFWQMFACSSIIFSIIFLFTRATNKGLFNKKTSRKFYEILHWEISRPNGDNVNLVLNVLLENFDRICKCATEDRSKTGNDARNILDVLLSEGSMVKLLSTYRLDGLLYIIEVLKKYKVDQRDTPKGVPLLVRGLFFDSDSFLYRQLDDSGLALSANLYDSLFNSPEILANFDIFGYPTVSFSAKGSTSDSTVNVFIESMSRSIETYLKTGNIPARNINRGIEHLSNIFGELCSNTQLEKDEMGENTATLTSSWWSLHRIAHFFGHDYLFIGREEVLNVDVTNREKTAQTAGFFSDTTINSAIAGALYKAFEQLSVIKKTNDRYNHVLDLLHGIVYEPALKEGYVKPFEDRIWEQIGKNVLGKYYPMVLKTYLDFIGFCLVGDNGQRRGWAGEQAERMRRLLYVDLKPQIDNDEKMVDGTPMREALLPDCMDYRNGKYYYTMGFGRGPEVEITPPPIGSISALDGVDWENSRSLI